MKKQTVLVMSFIICLVGQMTATAAETDGLEGTFLSWGAGARAMGIGKAFSAIVDDASATYWNPAGLTKLQRSELTGLHAQLWEGGTFDFVSFAVPTMVEGTFGWHATLLALGGGERRDAENNVLSGSFGAVKAATGASWAFRITSWLSGGVTAKYIGRWLDGWQTGFVTGDLGLLAELPYDVTVAVTGKHLVNWRHGDTLDTLPALGRLGIAWRPMGSLAVVGMDIEQSGEVHAGVELSPFGPFFLRAGSDRLESAMGGGLHYQDVGIDYTACVHKEFGFSHRMSFTLQFGDTLPMVRLTRAKQSFEEAYGAYRRGDKEAARRLAEEVLALDPDNAPAQFLKDKLSR